MAVSSADKKKLGKWIKQAREKKQPHLSQRQLALAVDITNASLSSIESGMIFPSEELLLKLIEQLQPPPELREKMLALFAKAKGTSPPDINAELSKNPKLWGLIRQLMCSSPTQEPRPPFYLFRNGMMSCARRRKITPFSLLPCKSRVMKNIAFCHYQKLQIS